MANFNHSEKTNMTIDKAPKHLYWQDGLSTRPDVDLLLSAYPDLKEGDQITYIEIEALVLAKPTSQRFWTVTSRWRRRLLERGIVVDCVAKEAFYVLNAAQIVAATHGTFTTIGRKAKRQRHRLSVARPVDELQRAMIEHQGRLLHEVERDTKKKRMNLLPSTATAEQARIEPPKSALRT